MGAPRQVACIYGGVPYRESREALRRGVDRVDLKHY